VLDTLARQWTDTHPTYKGTCLAATVVSKDSNQVAAALGPEWDGRPRRHPARRMGAGLQPVARRGGQPAGRGGDAPRRPAQPRRLPRRHRPPRAGRPRPRLAAAHARLAGRFGAFANPEVFARAGIRSGPR
jgi:hypothetical protein